MKNPKLILSVLSLLAVVCQVRGAGRGEGSDLEIGGPGAGRGQLLGLQDFTFDDQNRLYVLEGRYWDGKQNQAGNLRVQVFDNTGKPLSEVSLRDTELDKKNDPARLAVDSRGTVWVTQPAADLVEQFAPDGRLLNKLPLPGASAIAVQRTGGQERIVVATSRHEHNQWQPVSELATFTREGQPDQPIKLDRPLANCDDLTADAAGNLYAHADLNQLYKFSPTGKLLAVLGAGTMFRAADGSELVRSVAVDSLGRIYSNTYGNPSNISRFDPELTTVTQREGQFAWADAWGAPSILRVDRTDRLWVGVTGLHKGDQKYHYRPCVIRLQADFLGEKQPKVSSHSALLLGLNFAVETKLPYNVGTALSPTTVDFVVKAGNRRVHNLDVNWVVYDLFKTAIAHGQFALALQDGQESRQPITFTPPRWGWYEVEFDAAEKGQRLMGLAGHIGFTPPYPGMALLTEGASKGGWVDPVRQAFAGLPLVRANTGQVGLTPDTDRILNEVEQYNLTFLLQFQGKAEAQTNRVAEVVTKLKGRVKYYEIINEPNFSISPQDYVALLKQDYALIKSIDPDAKVLGPSVCGINLGWYEAFYKAGGKDFTDILPIHDYEGNESIDPGHWVWKIGELRKLMARYGDADKPIWQTERAIGGVRAANFQPGAQAVRILLQRDLLETLGIPAEHNNHYYLNQGGYSTVPTYIWSSSGPHPAALATRTRQAMIAGRTFITALNFGPTGNKLFMGLRYVSTNACAPVTGPPRPGPYAGCDETITLRNLGTDPLPLELRVSSGTTLEVVDAFGNSQRLPIEAGKIKLTVSALPVYLRLDGAQNQKVRPPLINFGVNHAAEATFRYSAPVKGDDALLTDGILESTHAGNPHHEIWSGDFPQAPQTLEITFPHPRTVNRVLLFSVRADNPYCALLDYDLQYHNGQDWVTLREVRAAVPPSDPIHTAECKAITWYLDQNFSVNDFAPVTAQKLRVVVRRTTDGFMPDDIAVKAAGWPANAPHLMLREVEIYGPDLPAELLAWLDTPTINTAAAHVPLRLKVTNRTKTEPELIGRLRLPAGWTTAHLQIALTAHAGGSTGATVDLRPPPDLPVGRVDTWIELVNTAGEVLDFAKASLEIAAPVEVTPKMPSRIDETAQPLTVAIKNIGSNDVTGTVELTLRGPKDLPPLTTSFGVIAPGQATNVDFAVPGLKLAGQPWQANYRVIANHLVVKAEQNLAGMRMWNIVGPFPNEGGSAFGAVYGPETKVDLSANYPGAAGQTNGWKIAASQVNGFLDFTREFQPNNNVCAYAMVYVKCPADRTAMASVGSDDGFKLWVNSHYVAGMDISRGAAPGQDKASVPLRQGWNQVLLKITQTTGGWGFFFDLLTSDGQPMLDLMYAPKQD